MTANQFTRDVLLDFLQSVVWPAANRFTATAGQTDFTLSASWDTANDVPLAWVNGNRVANPTWLSATQVQLAVAAAEDDVVVVIVTPGGGSGYLPRSGLSAMGGNLPMGSNRITGLGASVSSDDAIRRDEVATLALASGNTNFLRKDGTNWPPTADLAMGGRSLTGIRAAAAAAEPTRMDQVALLDGSQPFTAEQSGVTPTAAAHLATKGYVDGAVNVATDKKVTAGVDGAIVSLNYDGTVFRASSLSVAGTETTFNGCTLVYVQGDAEISGQLTLKRGSVSQLLNDRLSVKAGGDGADSADQGNGGGGYGVGGRGFSEPGNAAEYETRITDLWRSLIHYVGGNGGDGDAGGTAGGLGGGSLILIVDGTLTISGSIIASGADGVGAAGGGSGGGAGGSVRCYATVAIDGTGGLIDVSGGDWGNTNQSGGGAGGYIGLVSPSIIAPTVDISAGASYSPAGGGTVDQIDTYTSAEIIDFLRSAGL